MRVFLSWRAWVLSGAVLVGCGTAPPPAPVEWVAPALAQLQGEEHAQLTSPPSVPPPIHRDHATKVIVNLEVIEKVGEMAPGVSYTYWTFGGSVPGSFIRVRRGDLVEFHLQNNPNNKMPHNIDLHAVTGPGGGATSSLTPPGHETIFSFQALNEGVFVYHCATAPVGMHIGNGMYGLILVEPEAGLPPVDREYYVMQGDFYTAGRYGEPGLQPFDMDKALAETPDYVVFNGAVGALTGSGELTAEVGQRVRLFVGNGGPNLVSSFHAIGEIFDHVSVEGGSVINQDVQTTLVPPGGATMVDFKVQVPGEVILVDHAIFRAFNKGALGKLKVSGPENTTVYSGKQSQIVYMPEGGASQTMPGSEAPSAKASTPEERVARGKETYTSICAACHMAEGQGVPGAFPPLAGSDFLNADPERAIHIVGRGLQGKVTVNGATYDSVMPELNLQPEQIANVLTYVYSKWGNSGVVIDEAQVVAALAKAPGTVHVDDEGHELPQAP